MYFEILNPYGPVLAKIVPYYKIMYSALVNNALIKFS